MQARVVVYREGKMELCVPVAEPGAGIGRDAQNAIQLAAPEVSKQHAFIKRSADGWHLMDMNSRNGVLLNGKRVREATVRNGDRLSVGPYVLVFETVGAGQSYKPLLQIDLSDNAVQQTMPAPRRNNG